MEEELSLGTKLYYSITALVYLGGVLGLIAIVFVFVKGGIWTFDNIYQTTSLIMAGLLLLIVPFSLILLIPKKTREFGGAGFYTASYILSFMLWFWSLIVAKILAGTVWLLIGLFFAGIGVIPIAIIATLIEGNWVFVVSSIVTIIIIWILRFIGLFFLDPKENSNAV